MSDRDQYPAGVPCWVDTTQPDVDAALRFYGELFGWDFAGPGEMPTEPPGRYYVGRTRDRDAAGISSQPPHLASAPASWNSYIAVDCTDAAAARVADAGGQVISGPFDAPPAGRMAVVSDPAGAAFCIWEAGDRRGAQVVNEPSAWAMSVLTTVDLERAAAFYGDVFGWTTQPLDTGGNPITLLRLPGYVGGEPQQPVARDVVAAMMAPLGGGNGAQWSVDFWVRDTDGAAATVERLGGSLVAAPHDTPGFRRAVIADPQGAALSISQLTYGA